MSQKQFHAIRYQNIDTRDVDQMSMLNLYFWNVTETCFTHRPARLQGALTAERCPRSAPSSTKGGG